MSLERDLHDLLYTHDCVIVPGLGGFLAHYKGARLDAHRHTVHPPGKELSFNRHLTRDDGLLTDQRARREGIGYSDARERVGAEVGEWRARLEREGRLEIRSIGTLHADATRNLMFQPDVRVNFLKDAHGLRPLVAVPVVRASVVEPRPTPVVRAMPVPEERTERRAANGMERLWAAAALAAALFGTATWFVYQRGTDVTWASTAWWPTSEQPIYASRTTALPQELVTSDEATPLMMPVEQPASHAVDTTSGPDEEVTAAEYEATTVAPDTTRVAAPVVAVMAARYHVIGGCFSVQENADKFLTTLRNSGFDAVLVDQHHGLYRVAFGSYPDRATAMEALAAVHRTGAHEAWLLKR